MNTETAKSYGILDYACMTLGKSTIDHDSLTKLIDICEKDKRATKLLVESLVNCHTEAFIKKVKDILANNY